MRYRPYVTTAQILLFVALAYAIYLGILYFRGRELVDLCHTGLMVFVSILLIRHLRKKAKRK